MPELKPIAAASTDPQTDVAPLMPHSHGVRDANLVEAIFIPSGNPIPINRPIGKSIVIVTRTRVTIPEPSSMVKAKGTSVPKRATVRIRKSRYRWPERMARSVSILWVQ